MYPLLKVLQPKANFTKMKMAHIRSSGMQSKTGLMFRLSMQKLEVEMLKEKVLLHKTQVCGL